MLRLLNLSHNHLHVLDHQSMPQTIGTLDLKDNDLKELTNFEQSRFPYLKTLGFSMDQFSCEYLAETLIKDWKDVPHMLCIGYPFEQKHGQACFFLILIFMSELFLENKKN